MQMEVIRRNRSIGAPPVVEAFLVMLMNSHKDPGLIRENISKKRKGQL
jgi:hypothetical protein